MTDVQKMTYSLENDLVSIKKQIKEWEREMDAIIKALAHVYVESTLGDIPRLQDRLNVISDEMMAINI